MKKHCRQGGALNVTPKHLQDYYVPTVFEAIRNKVKFVISEAIKTNVVMTLDVDATTDNYY